MACTNRILFSLYDVWHFVWSYEPIVTATNTFTNNTVDKRNFRLFDAFEIRIQQGHSAAFTITGREDHDL